MNVIIVVGINWGDEGKGRIVDLLAQNADFVIRYQGGNNAGHTIMNEFGKFKLHLIPSGIFSTGTVNVLGPGTVINLEALSNEMMELKGQGIEISESNFVVSDRAVICFPFHVLQDEYEEARLGANAFGSTKRGIAPIYADLASKYAIQTNALLKPSFLKAQIERVVDYKNRIFLNVYGRPALKAEDVLRWALEYGERVKPHLRDVVELFAARQGGGGTAVLEAQLGALRDIVYGIYPFTTSSCTLSHFGSVGSGLFWRTTPRVIGVMKAFSTCVGAGPFVTEILGELADNIRERSDEYGAATGRARRIGHFDAVASRYGVRLQTSSALALTKLDTLSGLKSLKICTQYDIGGKRTTSFPHYSDLVGAKPAYIDMPGWQEDIRSVRRYDDLPAAAKTYVETIERLVECPIEYISVGPERESIILRGDNARHSAIWQRDHAGKPQL